MPIRIGDPGLISKFALAGFRNPKKLARVARGAFLIDASNVIGARPDGWWRDRPGATLRLLDAMQPLSELMDVTVVLDAGDPALFVDREDRLRVVIARERGRNAADDEIVALLEADPNPANWTVVTSDSALAHRARTLGASVIGSGRFRANLGF